MFGLLSQFSSSPPTLVPGQVIEAVVLLLEDGSVRLALPGGATLDVHSTIPLTAGVPVRLVVKSTGLGLQLVALPQDRASAVTATFELKDPLKRPSKSPRAPTKRVGARARRSIRSSIV